MRKIWLFLFFSTQIFGQLKVGSNRSSISNNLYFETEAVNGSKVSITRDSGMMGIGTVTPTNRLHIKDTINGNPLRLEGLLTGLSTDSILSISSTGVVKKVVAAGIEPWYSVSTNKGATSNTDSIYTMGKVGIGTSTPKTSSILELSATNKAFLPTRVSLTASTDTVTVPSPVAGMMVYNTSTTADVFPSFYYFNGTRWVSFFDNRIKFFYSPSISIPITAIGSGYTVNLYDQYTANFSTPAVKSPSAPSSIPVFAASELNFYVSNYDPSILANITISDTGLMTYDVIATTPSYCSFVNVIFTLK